MAVRFDRPLDGQYAASLWLPCSLSTQAGAKRSLKVPHAFYFGARGFRAGSRLPDSGDAIEFGQDGIDLGADRARGDGEGL